MPQSTHGRAAELHNLASHTHDAAAESHGKADHLTAHKHSEEVVEEAEKPRKKTNAA